MTRTLYRPDTPAEADRKYHEVERSIALRHAYLLREYLPYCGLYSRPSFEKDIAKYDARASAHAKKLEELK